jgi:GNAT superfamily N-acetyltransferase
MSREWRHDGYVISTDTSRLHLETVHSFLKTSYWAAGVPFEVVERSVQNSMVFGVYRGAEQAGFARVVTDRATFAYLADVFVLETHRGRGLGEWLIETILSHPDCRDSGAGCSPPETPTDCTGNTTLTACRLRRSS